MTEQPYLYILLQYLNRQKNQKGGKEIINRSQNLPLIMEVILNHINFFNKIIQIHVIDTHTYRQHCYTHCKPIPRYNQVKMHAKS